MISLLTVARYSGLVSFVVGLPTLVGTYYQVWRTRQEAKETRQGLAYSQNCLEFVLEDGTFVNVVPLETLHSLPRVGDVVLLPGGGVAGFADGPAFGAYRVTGIEQLYAGVGKFGRRRPLPGQAHLVKAVAHVEPVSGGKALERVMGRARVPAQEDRTLAQEADQHAQPPAR